MTNQTADLEARRPEPAKAKEKQVVTATVDPREWMVIYAGDEPTAQESAQILRNKVSELLRNKLQRYLGAGSNVCVRVLPVKVVSGCYVATAEVRPMTADQQPVPGGSGTGNSYCNECGEPPSNHTEVQRKLHGLGSRAGRLRCRDCARVVGDTHTVVNPDHQVEAIGSRAGSTVDFGEWDHYPGAHGDSCRYCNLPWPCDAHKLRAALEAAQGELKNGWTAEQAKRQVADFNKLCQYINRIADALGCANPQILGQLALQQTDLAQARARIVELEQRVAARPVCAKCRGTGRFEYRRDSWGDCPACDGRGH